MMITTRLTLTLIKRGLGVLGVFTVIMSTRLTLTLIQRGLSVGYINSNDVYPSNPNSNPERFGSVGCIHSNYDAFTIKIVV